MDKKTMNSQMLAELICGGIRNLVLHKDEVNDLNVFPIPDGDTGNNMLMTMQGSETAVPYEDEGVGEYARRAADGMLFSARGNSGVILSQIADGMAAGLEGVECADVKDTERAFLCGVEHAYSAVAEPVEGTILTVVREAAEYASSLNCSDIQEYLDAFLHQAHESLSHTPELLEILKKSGVVDSGGAGLIYIVEGALSVLKGEAIETVSEFPEHTAPAAGLNFDLFNEDSELVYGYCTELLLRLQRKKTDIEHFDLAGFREYLQSIGDSVVCLQTGSVVKLHVHTKEPYLVLQYGQRFGEYLTVKIENMSLQHNNLPADSKLVHPEEHKQFGVVAVATGEGNKKNFREMGTDQIVQGGQTMNPSADDFIEAFRRINADTIFVLPNNSNVILTAEQAAKLYEAADIRVIPSRSIGDGYAILSMLDLDSGDPDAIERDMNQSMEGVVTGSVTQCIRDTEMDGFHLREGQYLGIVGKEIVSADNDRRDTACMLTARMDFTGHQICIIVRGKDSTEEEAEEIVEQLRKEHRDCEFIVQNGGQELYSYYVILE
ncbi:MAG: DAK2 domain-containing protein [Eubacterium sp.]|nr:DAK2 domain-containing protein [Eubacterium sp.]